MDDLIGEWTSDVGIAPATSRHRLQAPDRTMATLESIHRRKTGALISAAVEMGAAVVNASDEVTARLAAYAADLGLAFQVTDDCLDATAEESDMGKRIGKDVAMGKLTYVGLIGVEAATQKAVDLVASAKQNLGPLDARRSGPLLELADYVLQRTR